MTNIKFDDYLQENLKNPEYQKEWLKQTALEYINTGNFEQFFSDLEDVIRATTTISAYAEKVDMNRVQLTKLLKNKTKVPNLNTINQVIAGLGLDYQFKCEIILEHKSA